MEHKVISWEATSSLLQTQVGTKVLVGGCFDIIHIGHIRFLQEAKKQGDTLIVALESDEFIRARKKREPFHTQDERAHILSHIVDIDRIITLPFFTSDNDYRRLVTTVKPDVIAITENDPEKEKKLRQAKDVGAKLTIVLSHVPNKATSTLRAILESMG